MKLNLIEKALMNNPVRALVQRHEAALMERFGGRVEGGRVLEIGCGRGVGTEIIFERFGAREVHAFDVDPDMIARARRRLSGYSADRLRLFVGDAEAIKAEDASYDAVFDFGIIHHVPDWQRAVAEVARVLKPGGRFFFEEVTKHALDRWFYRTFLEHPKTNRFSGRIYCRSRTTGGHGRRKPRGVVFWRFYYRRRSALKSNANSWRRIMQKATKKVDIRIAVVLALVSCIGVIVALRTAASAQVDNEKAVTEVLQQEAAAFEKGEVDALNKFWANDEWVSVFESGGADIGWANYRDHHLIPEMKELKNTKHTLSDIRVRVAGKTAWATFKYTLAGDLKERHIDVNGLGTAVLEERNGRWLLVHRHTSARRRAPTPAPAASPAKN